MELKLEGKCTIICLAALAHTDKNPADKAICFFNIGFKLSLQLCATADNFYYYYNNYVPGEIWYKEETLGLPSKHKTRTKPIKQKLRLIA